jgi:hypothetical protein
MKYEVFLDDMLGPGPLPPERMKEVVAAAGAAWLAFPCAGRVKLRSISFSGPPVRGDTWLVESRLVIFIVRKLPAPHAVAVQLEVLDKTDRTGLRPGATYLAMLQPTTLENLGLMIDALPSSSLEVRIH